MNWNAIRKEFEESDITMKALAEKHGVPPATLRSRKSREKWEKHNATKNVATRNATKRKNIATKKAVEKVQENSELTEKQKLFCLYFSQLNNATKAYQKAYECSYDTAQKNSWALMANQGIRKEIKHIKAARSSDWLINDADIINEWMKQAFTDITNYVEFRKVFVDYIRDDKNMPKLDELGNMIPFYRNELHFKNSNEVDGTVIQEVKKGKDGVSVKLYDKQRALIELHKLIGGENTLKLKLMQVQVDKISKDLKIDTSTEDKLKGYFEKLGAEVDGTN